MKNPISIVLASVIALLLVSAQATWGSAIKNQKLLEGAPLRVVQNLITSPKIWLGAAIYVLATAVYFVLLSKNKFFFVQITMTAVAIILSTILSAVLFHEKLRAVNVAGMGTVLLGLIMVIAR